MKKILTVKMYDLENNLIVVYTYPNIPSMEAAEDKIDGIKEALYSNFYVPEVYYVTMVYFWDEKNFISDSWEYGLI
jgi:hypothetical protein